MTHIEQMKKWLKAFEIVRFCVPPAQRKTIADSISSLSQAIGQAENQEPIGEVIEVNNKQVNRDWLAIVKISKGVPVGSLLYTHPQPKEKQEHLGYIDMREWPPIRFLEGLLRCDLSHLDGAAIYTHPQPQKPLTREVIERDFHGRVDFVRQVEAAHNIKE